MLYFGNVKDFIYCGALAQRLIHDKVAVAGRMCQHEQQFFFGFGVIVLCVSQSVSARLKAADCFLESFLVGFADAHDLADGTHLCAKLVLDALEFLKCPARKFDHDIVAVGHIAVECAIFAALDFFQR